jgi:hypothetical protein
VVRVRPGLGRSRITGASADLLRGLHAGDLGTILLAVEMAADDNLLACGGPEEEGRILAFLERLAAFDAVLPPEEDPDRPGGSGHRRPPPGAG